MSSRIGRRNTLRVRRPTLIFSGPPLGFGWEPTKRARSVKQAEALVRGFEKQQLQTVVVQTGKKGDTFPFTVYTRGRLVVKPSLLRHD